jgi:hypothetical protein
MTWLFMAAAVISGYCVALVAPFPAGDEDHVDIDALFMRSEIGRFDLRIDPAPIGMVEPEQIDLPQSYSATGQYPNPF